MQAADIRKKIHQAIQTHVQCTMQLDTKQDPFLVIKSPVGNDIELTENEGDVELFFGLATENFTFNPDIGDDGEEGDLPNERGVLLEIAKTVKGIVDEKLFAAEYQRGSIHVNGVFEAHEFPELSKKPEFTSVSWNGKWSRE